MRAPGDGAQHAAVRLLELQGTWEAKATGAPGVAAIGTYTFRGELGHHILARYAKTASECKGPATFDLRSR